MKAAYANGVLAAFEAARFRPWDVVIGTSAGGALAAWYSAGQARYAEKTWDYAADRRIVDYGRFVMLRGPLLDHDALLEIVYEKELPIDQAAIHSSPHPVIVTASRLLDGGTTYHDLRDGPIIPWLKATGRLPFAAGRPVAIDGIEYLDGGITDPVPVRYAIETQGATEVTLVLNSAPGEGRPENPVLARMTGRRFPRLRASLLRHQELKREAVAWAEAPHPGATVHIIRPRAPTGLRRLTRDLELIHAGLQTGRADGEAHLAGLREPQLSETGHT